MIIRKLNYFLLLWGGLWLFSACSDSPATQTSFYFWRTAFQLNKTERNTLLENKSRKLYVRYFDIDLNKNGEVFPRAKIDMLDTTDCEIIPVIYIKNRVMLNEQWNMNELIDKTLHLVKDIHRQTHSKLKEIQIDCDWTIESRDRFLRFVKLFHRAWGGELSVTIRLHQVKYLRQTGIPDVNYGVLMYYNMGHIDELNKNSIYDKNIADRYIQSLSTYPLPLKVALPIFSWGIQTRAGKVVSLWNKKTRQDLTSDKNLKAIDTNRFSVIKSFYQQGKYFRKGDEIYYEGISKKDLREMAKDLKKNIHLFKNEIIFYDLDSINIQQYETNTFQKVSARF